MQDDELESSLLVVFVGGHLCDVINQMLNILAIFRKAMEITPGSSENLLVHQFGIAVLQFERKRIVIEEILELWVGLI
jgi:hypothetical protein